MKHDSIRTTIRGNEWTFKTDMFLSSDILLYKLYIYICVCVYIYIANYVHMCVYIYSDITNVTESKISFCTKSQRHNNEASEGWGLCHAVRGGTECFHGLFKPLEVFLTLIFTFI